MNVARTLPGVTLHLGEDTRVRGMLGSCQHPEVLFKLFDSSCIGCMVAVETVTSTVTAIVSRSAFVCLALLLDKPA